MMITIKRLEGSLEDCVEFKVESFKQADKMINIMSRTAPKEGYDKTRFEVVYNEDCSYEGRLDLSKRYLEEENILQSQMLYVLDNALKVEKDEGQKEEIVELIKKTKETK